MAQKKYDVNLEEAKRVNRSFVLLGFASAVTIITGTIVFQKVEGWTWVDSLYFSFVSLTTVGYGDITPESDTGKLLAIIYLIVGIGIIGAFLNNMIKGVAARRRIKEYESKTTKDS